jgi:hypothetical protein
MGVPPESLEKLVNLARSKWLRETLYRSMLEHKQRYGTSIPDYALKRDFEVPLRKREVEIEAYSAQGLTKLMKEKVVLDVYKMQLQICKDVLMDSEFLSNCYTCKNIYDKNEKLQKKSDVPVVLDYWCKPKNIPIDQQAEESVAGFCIKYDKNEASFDANVGEEDRIKVGEQIVAEQEAKVKSLLSERERLKNKLKFRI